jgi:hypothetical protein
MRFAPSPQLCRCVGAALADWSRNTGGCTDHEHRDHHEDLTCVQRPIFGSVGRYEQLGGTASGEIDPKDPLNVVIQDIELAPRNSRGMVEYSMDISILKHIDTSNGNNTILYDVVNRGSPPASGRLALDPLSLDIAVIR